jgi:hypothetical protein
MRATDFDPGDIRLGEILLHRMEHSHDGWCLNVTVRPSRAVMELAYVAARPKNMLIGRWVAVMLMAVAKNARESEPAASA